MDEPRKHRTFMVLLGMVALGTAPLAFVGWDAGSWLGVPVWLWSSAAFTLALSLLTAWGIVRYWRDDELE